MKLWLDDLRDLPAGYDQLARTVEEAIDCLKTGQVREVSLDYVLGNNRTGLEVAQWIEQSAAQGTLEPLIWHVHSSSPRGCREMAQVLERADAHWISRSSGG